MKTSREKLNEMMLLQEKFNTEVVPNHSEYWRTMNPFYSKEECLERVKDKNVPILSRMYMYLLHLEIELSEMIVHIPIKMWKKQEINWDELNKEFIDCVHFYLSLFSHSPKMIKSCDFSDNWKLDTSVFEENDYEKAIIKNYHELKEDIFLLMTNISEKIEDGCLNGFEIDSTIKAHTDRITFLMKDMAQLLFTDFEELYINYIKKMNINKDRQKNNY